MKSKKKPIFLFVVMIVSFCIGGGSVKIYSMIKSRLINQEIKWDITKSTEWDDKFELVEIPSSEDSKLQRAYFSVAIDSKLKKPLLVSLHTWSGSYLQKDPLAAMAYKEGWNYIHPDFRGPNWSKDACLSKLVITDIDDAIQYAINHSNVDVDNIFIVGMSGGGYAVLGTYLKTRHNIKTFLAWAPISDLSAWYHQSKSSNSKYAKDILKCTSDSHILDEKMAKKRSPIYWKIPKYAKGKLEIFAGINDGHEGSVPISHSILFFNHLVSNFGYFGSRVDEPHVVKLLTRNIERNQHLKIGQRAIFYKSVTPQVSLTIFDGGHEMLPKYTFNRLKTISKEGKIL